VASVRHFSEGKVQEVAPEPVIVQSDPHIRRVRNIGISAHIDSGKTTLSERILFYTGRIHEMHDVRGSDGKGAVMDSMELERQKGITIKSAATYTQWNDHHVNVIDTPGHVDFTIEVERSLRVLDGAIFVLCGSSGVQSQSMTVDKQMQRYDVPRIIFVNKLDRLGATPWKALKDVRTVLRHNCAAVQIPMGQESSFGGVVDIIKREAIYFDGPKGEQVRREAVPEEFKELMEEKRMELIERVADVDDELGEMFLSEVEPTVEQLKAAIRRATLGLKFIPMFMGTAFKNKGVQALLDGVIDYLPNPYERKNYAFDHSVEGKETKVMLLPEPKKPMVALAFKLEEGQYGQLTYMRVYQGTLKRGDVIMDMSTGQKIKVPRVMRMHSSATEAVDSIGAGEIAAISGVDCASGTTFTSGTQKLTLSSMHVPDTVISLAIRPKNPSDAPKFSKALNRFQREDPTFKIHLDEESQETIISGMGELHLEIYAERIKREYACETILGHPEVNYRETITQRADFTYTHKKQTGGQGQYGKIIGYIEPIPDSKEFEFVNRCVGQNIPPEYYPAIEKGFREAVEKGPLSGHPVQGVRVVLLDGGAHMVDSSELAFRLCAQYAFSDVYNDADPQILEPVMSVQVEVPGEFQTAVVASVNRRKGMIQSVDSRDGNMSVVHADVPLSKMFGYSTDLRSSTEGKGEFSMEFKEHAPVTMDEQIKINQAYLKKRAEKHK